MTEKIELPDGMSVQEAKTAIEKMANGENDNMSENNDKVVFESEEAFEEKVAEIISNRQNKSDKERLASEIVGNSTEYEDTETVLEDYPTEAALETKKKDVVGNTPDFSGAIGANANPANNTEDADDLTMFGSDA